MQPLTYPSYPALMVGPRGNTFPDKGSTLLYVSCLLFNPQLAGKMDISRTLNAIGGILWEGDYVTKLFDANIKAKILIRANPESVYDAFTTSKEMDRWFTRGADIEPKAGGKMIFRWKDWGPDKWTSEAHGKVVEADRPTRFVFQWHGDTKEYYTTIEMDFESVGEGTVVRLQESGYHDTPGSHESILDCATGWGEALTLLKFYVEHGVTY
jgi:uncharacterized protein YndB with AHSA1/START domain